MTVLIAEDNDVNRQMMAAVLETGGYQAVQASDGLEAIQKLSEHQIDLALVDINMAPQGGFHFVKHLVASSIEIPVVIITGDDAADVLIESGNLGVTRVIQKPVEPDRLLKLVGQIFKRMGKAKLPEPMASETHHTQFTPEELMCKAIALANKNIDDRNGRPFGAVIADENGKILGEGVSGGAARIDPTAHAEVMAIRKAAQKLGATSLSGCMLYCTGEPTQIGKALTKSVGIEKVYYGLSQGDIGTIREQVQNPEPQYEQICRDEAMDVFKKWTEE